LQIIQRTNRKREDTVDEMPRNERVAFCHRVRVIEKREEATRNVIGYRTRSSIRQYFLAMPLQLFSQQRANLVARLRVLLAFAPGAPEKRSPLAKGNVRVGNIFFPSLPDRGDRERITTAIARMQIRRARIPTLVFVYKYTTATPFAGDAADAGLGIFICYNITIL
jgi:hypothetical protein